jgi:hypothetical protein
MTCVFLACLYLSVGTADMIHHGTPPAGYYSTVDINDIQNPYGIAEVGWSRAFGKWDIEAAARHISSLAIDAHYGDFNHQYGQNTLEVRVRWFPFRQVGARSE